MKVPTSEIAAGTEAQIQVKIGLPDN